MYNEGNLSSQELLLHSDNRVEKKKYKLNPRTWEQKSGGPRVQGYSWFGITWDSILKNNKTARAEDTMEG